MIYEIVKAEWPLDPVIARVSIMIDKAEPTNKDIASACGVSERRIRNARDLGFIDDDYIADKMACGLHKHPTHLWPDFYKNANTWFASDIQEGKITVEKLNELTAALKADKVEA